MKMRHIWQRRSNMSVHTTFWNSSEQVMLKIHSCCFTPKWFLIPGRCVYIWISLSSSNFQHLSLLFLVLLDRSPAFWACMSAISLEGFWFQPRLPRLSKGEQCNPWSEGFMRPQVPACSEVIYAIVWAPGNGVCFDRGPSSKRQLAKISKQNYVKCFNGFSNHWGSWFAGNDMQTAFQEKLWIKKKKSKDAAPWIRY